jgi:peptidoglycan hydrolase CwlO-like protein
VQEKTDTNLKEMKADLEHLNEEIKASKEEIKEERRLAKQK